MMNDDEPHTSVGGLLCPPALTHAHSALRRPCRVKNTLSCLSHAPSAALGTARQEHASEAPGKREGVSSDDHGAAAGGVFL